MNIDELLRYAAKYGASDLHITVGNPPIIRVQGRLKKIPGPALAPEDAQALVFSILSDEQRQAVERKRELDLSYTWGTSSTQPAADMVSVEYVTAERVRARVNVFLDQSGIGGAFRIIPGKIRTLDELPAPNSVAELTRCPSGLVLVTGPTGCGKSTTLASMIDLVDQERSARIITIEDPIEFLHESKKCLINQRELGPHTLSFPNALRSALREDPDYVLVGEMRDLETIRLALTAAETGHLVFATLHTSSAAKTIDRIIDVFPAAEKDMVRAMLSESLVAVISQTLLKTKDGQGRVAAHEIMTGTPAIRNLIRENKVAQMYSAIQTGQAMGMQTLDQNLTELVRRNIVSASEARTRAVNRELFMG